MKNADEDGHKEQRNVHFLPKGVGARPEWLSPLARWIPRWQLLGEHGVGSRAVKGRSAQEPSRGSVPARSTNRQLRGLWLEAPTLLSQKVTEQRETREGHEDLNIAPTNTAQPTSAGSSPENQTADEPCSGPRENHERISMN